jgi:hypothetical protein
MQRQVILVRFGEVPNPAITMVLAKHITGKAIALPVPGAIMSVFFSESTIKSIADDLKQVGPNFFIFDRDNDAMNLPKELIEVIDKAMGEEAQRPIQQREWTIDEVLDIISRQGMEALTPEQKAVLERGEL